MMKAACIYGYGSPDVFRIEERPLPRVKPRDVLIEVHAASVNPVDYKIRQGGQRGAIKHHFPAILGLDVSGRVVEVGRDVVAFQPGDEVYSSPTHSRDGTYAEYVAIDVSAVAHKPPSLTHQQAASLPLVALTAYEALVVRGHMQPGERVFVQAGAGGVGSIAIQMAKALGGYVATSCSTRNIERVQSYGADQVIDYTEEDFDEVLRDFDQVIEALGGAYLKRSLRILKPGGHLAMLTTGMPANTAKYGPLGGLVATGWGILSFSTYAKWNHNVSVSPILRQSLGNFLDTITAWVEDGKIRPVIDKVFPLDQIIDAHRAIETGRTRGKIVIAVKPEADDTETAAQEA